MTAVDAIVLAGGRATRMGGIDKPGLVIGGRSLLSTALDAVASSCARTVVVGPYRQDLDAAVRQVRETPPGAGPVAALEAGLAACADDPAPLVVALAADMPFLTGSVVAELVRHQAESGADAVFAADDTGRPQYLLGVWRREALTGALAKLDTPVNQPMKALVPVDTVVVEMSGISDVDTPEQVREARAEAGDTAGAEQAEDRAPLSLEQARDVLRTGLTRLAPRRAELRGVRGAALAESLTARGPLPRFDVSAMDGYAVAGEGPWRLRADIGFAGGERPSGLLLGEAVRIATGAHVPDGASGVLRDEFAEIRPDAVLHRVPGTPVRDDIRRCGEDRETGDTVAPQGSPVTSALISAAASVEVTDGMVRGPVRARIVMTGDEIRGEGPLHAGQTRDSIGPVLPDILAHYGIRADDRVHLRDTPHGFDEILSAADDVDLLVIVGATGGGAADQLREAVARAHVRVLVHRLRLRPGGSTLVAETLSGVTVLGLPGNPFAALATLMTLADAVVAGRTGAGARRPLTGPLHNASAVSAAVTRIVPARIAAEGGWTGDPHIRTAHLGGLVDRDGIVVVPSEARDGAIVEFLPLPA
ncbi:NTP transferase domain-containing protein [Nocardia bovistercoris]|uniref:Molybdopterin molybdenumtransferase n=1 Tax=Nocardia bovistercoris TaxID=2785916 RepID=A0A931N168_9NOCA|nr:NTP transferase domain-containing protein [Nocardia bovistercoris]MBH0775684.1 NTP transferase domain-containing protein [Nocardia bovistercoris]